VKHILFLPALLPALVLVFTLAVALAPLPASANPIERACLQSERTAANRSLCSCIGQAARRTLTGSQMREGARFFTDPQRAQDVRTSNSRRHTDMWNAWRNFGDTAEAMCS